MRTNSKVYMENFKNYLLKCMGEEEPYTPGQTEKEKFNILKKTFNAEFNYEENKRRYPNTQDRLANWLQGLPSCISLDYTYNDIFETCKRLKGFEDSREYTEVQKDKMCHNWFNFAAYKIIKISEKFNIFYN